MEEGYDDGGKVWGGWLLFVGLDVGGLCRDEGVGWGVFFVFV